MKNWIKRTLVALFGAGIVAGGVAACSHGQRGHGGFGSDEERAQRQSWMIDRVAGKLDLDDAQKQKLGTLAQRMREQRQALMGGGGADARAEFGSLIAGSSFDKTRAQALLDEKIAAVLSKSPDVIAAMAEFYDSLRPAQQQQVRDFLERRRHGGWRARG